MISTREGSLADSDGSVYPPIHWVEIEFGTGASTTKLPTSVVRVGKASNMA